jgi:hypothetical protein
MSVSDKNPGRVEFTAEIRVRDGGGAFVEFPHDVENLYGLKGRVPVKVTFDGIPFRGSMIKLGGPMHLLHILKEIREKLGKGDRIRVTVDLDEAPRVVLLAGTRRPRPIKILPPPHLLPPSEEIFDRPDR